VHHRKCTLPLRGTLESRVHDYLTRLPKNKAHRSRAKHPQQRPSGQGILTAPIAGYVNNPIRDSRYLDPFPERLRKSLRYGQQLSLSTDTTGPTQNKFGTATALVLNSLFAPVSGGHQPYGFDQLAALYQRYKVTGVDIRLTVEPALYDAAASNSTQLFAMLVLPPGVSGTIGGSTVDVILEKPLSAHISVTPGSGSNTINIKQHFDVSRYLGVTRAQYNANIEDYQALCTASPARVLTLEFATTNVSTTTAAGLRVTLEADFHAEFFQRTILTQS
jgi:hypothetical protein